MSTNKFSLVNFDQQIISPNEEIPGLRYIIDSGLIPDEFPKNCIREGCNGLMKLQSAKESVLKKAFVCRTCRKQMSWTSGTIFANTKLSILMFLKVIFCWCMNKSISAASIDLGISEVTISYQYKMLRMVCYNIIHGNPFKIGGPGKIVEIDETMIYKRKYNRGRLLSAQKKQVWVFGGIERESKLAFAEVVDKRDEETLKKVIEKYILPGTTIYSDGWKAYQNLSNYNFYHHDSVNHSKNFLNPLDKTVHTQTIERKWKSVKEHIPKSSNGPNRNDHLIEFLYKSKYHSKKEPRLNFETTLQHLKNDPYSLNYLDVYDYDD